MPSIGDKAPDFQAPAHDGSTFRLSDQKGRITVLYFYPRAMTPGCTREGVRFNELYEEFKRLGAEIYGVSTDSPNTNKRFAEKHGFRFKLLSDRDGEIARLYGVLKKGTKRPSAQRVTFIIAPDLTIAAILKNIRPAERHADEALSAVRRLVEQTDG